MRKDSILFICTLYIEVWKQLESHFLWSCLFCWQDIKKLLLSIFFLLWCSSLLLCLDLVKAKPFPVHVSQICDVLHRVREQGYDQVQQGGRFTFHLRHREFTAPTDAWKLWVSFQGKEDTSRGQIRGCGWSQLLARPRLGFPRIRLSLTLRAQ